MSQRRGGVIQIQANGVLYDAKGSFTYNLGQPKRESIMGHDGFHGIKLLPQVTYLEGEFTDRGNLNVKQLLNLEDATITLTLANGKTVLFREAFYAGDGNISTEEGNIEVRFEAAEAEEI